MKSPKEYFVIFRLVGYAWPGSWTKTLPTKARQFQVSSYNATILFVHFHIHSKADLIAEHFNYLPLLLSVLTVKADLVKPIEEIKTNLTN